MSMVCTLGTIGTFVPIDLESNCSHFKFKNLVEWTFI